MSDPRHEGPGPGPGEETASVHHHRRTAPRHLAAAVITVSDTRTLETDTGGGLVVELLEGAGHRVAHRTLVPDDRAAIAAIRSSVKWRPAVGAATAPLRSANSVW